MNVRKFYSLNSFKNENPMESQRISELQEKLKPENLNTICSNIANRIKTDIIDTIQSETKLLVGERITSDKNSVSIDGTKIPIEEFHPSFTSTTGSRSSVFADKSLWTGEVLLKRTFFNPKRNIIRQRSTPKEYPIFKVNGPSTASLYKQKKQQFKIDQKEIVQDELKDL